MYSSISSSRHWIGHWMARETANGMASRIAMARILAIPVDSYGPTDVELCSLCMRGITKRAPNGR